MPPNPLALKGRYFTVIQAETLRDHGKDLYYLYMVKEEKFSIIIEIMVIFDVKVIWPEQSRTKGELKSSLVTYKSL